MRSGNEEADSEEDDAELEKDWTSMHTDARLFVVLKELLSSKATDTRIPFAVVHLVLFWRFQPRHYECD